MGKNSNGEFVWGEWCKPYQYILDEAHMDINKQTYWGNLQNKSPLQAEVAKLRSRATAEAGKYQSLTTINAKTAVKANLILAKKVLTLLLKARETAIEAYRWNDHPKVVEVTKEAAYAADKVWAFTHQAAKFNPTAKDKALTVSTGETQRLYYIAMNAPKGDAKLVRAWDDYRSNPHVYQKPPPQTSAEYKKVWADYRAAEANTAALKDTTNKAMLDAYAVKQNLWKIIRQAEPSSKAAGRW